MNRFSFRLTSLSPLDGTPAVQHLDVYPIPCPPEGLGKGGCLTTGSNTYAQLYPQYYATFLSARYANTADCLWAMGKVIEGCPKGDYNDTQGGWWEFANDKSTYGMDPSRIVDFMGGAP